MIVFVGGKVAGSDNTIAIAVGVSVPSIAAAAVIVAVLIYCYKAKNRYRKFYKCLYLLINVKKLQFNQVLTATCIE